MTSASAPVGEAPELRGLGFTAALVESARQTFVLLVRNRLLWFVVPMGIAAGYTFDLVYAKLRQADAMPGNPLTPPAGGTGPTVAN